MRSAEIVPKVVVLLAVLAAARVGHAQTTNISAVVRGGVVVVSYDLISNNPASEFSIVLEASSDGGKTYSVRPRTLKGDVGPAVRAGIGKQITWQAAQDVESLDVDRYRYRVVAQPVRPADPAPAQRAQVPTNVAPQPNQQPNLAQETIVSSGGNGRRWGGIALLGAGGTLAVLGATVMKHEDYYTNKPLVWAGLATAGGGAALLAIGGGNDSVGTQILIGPRGVMVQHRRRFQ